MTEIVGPAAENVPGLAITDNHDLYTCIHNLTSCEDKRLLDNILQIREAIYEDKVITEVRFCTSKENLADCLTKISRKTSQDLMTTLRTGSYTIPGGSTIRDSTQLSIKTWQQLVTAEKETGEAQHCLARLENFAVRGVRLLLRQKDSEAMAV